MPLILGANSVSGGYEVDNSLRFNSGSNDNLTRTPASATNRRTFTVSFWYKRSVLSTRQEVFSQYAALNNNEWIELAFNSDDTLFLSWYSAGVFTTNQLFRDVGAWYHIVLAVDTTQATDTNRIKLYVNGSQVTSFSSITYPAQNYDTGYNQASSYHIGDLSLNGNFDLNGYLAEYYSIDGQALTPSSFGETDQDTNIWIPKAYTGTFGTNGFYLEFQNSGALGTDSSGNGNTFTVNNLTSIDQTTDTPTNNFATLNPLNNNNASLTFTNGNLSINNSGQWLGATSTIGVSKAKWYWEVKYISGNIIHGIIGESDAKISNMSTANSGYIGKYASGYAYYFQSPSSGKYNNDVGVIPYGTAPSANDILMFAFDADIGAIWVGRNGTWYASATQAEIEAGTTTNAMYSGISMTQTFFVGLSPESGASDVNFGNPPFTISSGNADANGYGNFEYAVPSGYYSLCTKNLAEYA